MRRRTSTPRSSSSPPRRTPRRTGRSPTPSGWCSGTTRRRSRPATERSDLWFIYHLGRRIRERLAGSADERDRPVLDLTWAYPDRGCERRAVGRRGARGDQRLERRRRDALRATPKPATTARPRAAAGSTAAATRTGSTRPHVARPACEQNWTGSDWAWAWPANRRILYNRASADPRGPAVERAQGARLVGRGGRTLDRARRARLRGRQAARTTARRRTRPARPRSPATTRSSCRPTGEAGCSPRPASPTARCRPTTSRRTRRSATRSTRQQRNPARQLYRAREQPLPPRSRRAGRRRVPVRGHHLPADRALHRRRDVALDALPVRAAAGVLLSRSRPSWPPSAASSTAAGRRSSPPAASIEARVMVTDRMTPLHGRTGATRPPDRDALPLGRQRLRARRLGERALVDGAGPELAHPGGQGADGRHPARPPAARAGAPTLVRDYRERAGITAQTGMRAVSRRACSTSVLEAAADPAASAGLRRPSAADGLLHRHLGLHRLQGVRGRLQGVEPGARGRAELDRASRTTTRSSSAPTPGATSRSSSSACRSASSDAEPRRATAGEFRWLMASDVCKHCTHAACLDVCPTGAIFRTRVRHRRGPGRTSATAAATASPPARTGSSTAARTTGGSSSARSATTGSAPARSPPARRRARPTRSSSARSTSCASAPTGAVEQLHDAGVTEARLYGRDPTTASAATARSSCCSTSPRCTGCRRTRSSRTRDLPRDVARPRARRRDPACPGARRGCSHAGA